MPGPTSNAAILVDWIHAETENARQERARTGGEYEHLRLAAYLFATTIHLHQKLLLDSVDLEPAQPCRSVEEALDALAGIPPGASSEEMYGPLLAALLGIDSEFAAVIEDAGLPSSTKVVAPVASDGNGRIFRGTVFHWLRPKCCIIRNGVTGVPDLVRGSVLPELRERRRQQSSKHPTEDSLGPAAELKNLGMYWTERKSAPRLRVVKPRRPSRLVREAGPWTRAGRFRLAFSPLFGKFALKVAIGTDGKGFTTHPEGPIVNHRDLRKQLRQVVEEAMDNDVALLVLPELCVDEAARDYLRKLLGKRNDHSLLAVIAGSFHVWKDGHPKPLNEGVVLDHIGNELWTHGKRGRFRLTRFAVKRLSKARQARVRIVGASKVSGNEVKEGIRPGQKLEICDTSLGRLAVLICADGLTQETRGYEALIKDVQADLVFVLCMSSETRWFDTFAERLQRRRIGALLINASLVCEPAPAQGTEERTQQTETLLFLARLALNEPEGAPPQHLRWRSGVANAEWYNRGCRQWQVIGTTDRSKGAFLLQHSVVVDLGVHWSFREPNGK